MFVRSALTQFVYYNPKATPNVGEGQTMGDNGSSDTEQCWNCDDPTPTDEMYLSFHIEMGGWVCESCKKFRTEHGEWPDVGSTQQQLITDGGQVEDDTEQTWPDDLELGDEFEFDGHTYEVVGTGPAEAKAERVDNDDYTVEVGRWAFTDAVYVELEVSMAQDEFGRSVQTATEQSEDS